MQFKVCFTLLLFRQFQQTKKLYTELKKKFFSLSISVTIAEAEFKEFEPRFKSAKTRFKLSTGLSLETFNTILSGTNHI